MKYVPLHCHSSNSVLDGYQLVEEYADYLTENGYSAGGITDHGTCAGWEHFDKRIVDTKSNVKPIFGIEAYLVDDVNNTLSDRVARDKKGNIKYDKKTGEPMLEPQRPSDFNHGCMWAKDNDGFSNIITLSTLAYANGFYYKPRIDLAMMKDYHNGIFVSDGCLLSQVGRAASNNTPEKGYDWVKKLISIFGKDNVLIELHTWQFCNPETEEQFKLNDDMKKANHLKMQIAKDLDLRVIAVNDAHYNKRSDWLWHELEWETTTHKGASYNDDKLGSRGETASWVMNDDEVAYWLKKHDIPDDVIDEAISNTSDIARECTAKFDRGMKPPRYCTTRKADEEKFDETIKSGIIELMPRNHIDEYMRRLNDEVELIKKCDLTGYFNVVADYANFVRAEDPDGKKYGVIGKHQSLLGPGRGSAASSIVCYFMHITNADPIKFNLIFERFLTAGRIISKVNVVFDSCSMSFNPSDSVKTEKGEKKAWQLLDEKWDTEFGKIVSTSFDFKDCPDIDLDFSAEVIPYLNEYLSKKYGRFNFCHIGTFQVLKMSSAIKDVARLEGMSPKDAQEIVNAVVATGWPVADTLTDDNYGEFASFANKNEELMDLYNNTDFFKKVWSWGGRIRSEGIHASGYIISRESLLGKIPCRIKNGVLVTQWEHNSCAEVGFIKYDILKLSSLDILAKWWKLTHNGELDVNAIYALMRNEKVMSNQSMWKQTWGGDTVGIFQMDTPLGTRTSMNAKIRSLRDAAMLSAADRPGLVRSGLIDDFYKVRLGIEPIKHYHPLVDPILKDTDGFVLYQEQVMFIFKMMCNMSLEETDGVRKVFSKKMVDKVEGMRKKLHDAAFSRDDFMNQIPSNYSSAEECFDDLWRGISRTAEYAFNSSHALCYGEITCCEQYMKWKNLPAYIVASLNVDPGNTNMLLYARNNNISVIAPNVNKSKNEFVYSGNDIYMPIYTIKGIGGAAVNEIVSNAPYDSLDDYLSKTSGRGGRKKNIVKSLISIGAFDGVDERNRFELMQYYCNKIGEEGPKRNTWKNPRIRGRIEKTLLGISLSYDPIFDAKEWLSNEGPQSIGEMQNVNVGQSFKVAGMIDGIKRHLQKNGQTMAWIDVTLSSREKVTVTMFARNWSAYDGMVSNGDIVSISCKRTEDFRNKPSYVAFSIYDKTLKED